MRFRGPLVVLAVLGLGLATGYAASHELQPKPMRVSAQRPVPAEDPAYPLGFAGSVLPDSSLPPLQGDLILVDERLKNQDRVATVPVPVGWKRKNLREGEARWIPMKDAVDTGYSVRVHVLKDDIPLRDMMIARAEALPGDPNITDIQRLQTFENTSSLVATIVRNGYRKLLLIRWISFHGDVSADVEIAWSGRIRDEAGMQQLLARMATDARSVSSPLD